MEFLYVLIPIVLLLVTIGVLAARAERRRRTGIAALAAERGWEYDPTADLVMATFGAMPLLCTGHGRKASNLIVVTDGPNAGCWIFDYQYVTGHGKNRTRHRQTVVARHDLPVGLPQFDLRPEHLFDKLGAFFGYQDIDFPEYPHFSGRFRLRGASEAAIRTLFNRRLITTLEPHAGLSIQADGRCLLVFQAAGRREVGDLPHLPGEVRPLSDAIIEAAGGAAYSHPDHPTAANTGAVRYRETPPAWRG